MSIRVSREELIIWLLHASPFIICFARCIMLNIHPRALQCKQRHSIVAYASDILFNIHSCGDAQFCVRRLLMRWAMPPEHPNPLPAGQCCVFVTATAAGDTTRIWQSSEANTSAHAMQQHNMHFVVFRTVASRRSDAASSCCRWGVTEC